MAGAAAAILIDGRRRRSLPADDRGFHYGDGLFETIAVRDGCPQLWEAHMARLRLGCEQLALPAPDTGQLYAEALALLDGCAEGVLKLIYTAGAGPRGYGRREPIRPTRILMLLPPPRLPAARWRDGVRVGYCALRLAPQGPLAGSKHLGRLEQVLARREVDGRGLDEGLLLDGAGHVVEATASNLFAVFGDRLLTPPLTNAGVRGVMRDHLLSLARERGFEVEETPLDPPTLDCADALFLTNSLIGLWPVRWLEGRRYDRGALARSLLRALVESAVCLAPNDLHNNA